MKTPGVLYTSPKEFVADLERDKAEGLIERNLVRLTKVGRPRMGGTITSVTVQAAAIVDRRVLRITIYCGDLWGNQAEDDKVQAKAREAEVSLRDELEAAGLEIRNGLFEED